MNKYISSFLLLAVTAATAAAQPKAEYERTEINLGVLNWKDPALATFKITNRGNRNLLIKRVAPGCDCTVVTWTKDPIRPGESGTLNVTYDAGMLGHFDKDVAVWTNADEKPSYLSISGEVVLQKLEYTGEYPYHIGDIYLSSDNIEFDDLNKGDRRQAVLSVLNTGKKPYDMELMHLPKYLTAEAQPKTLRSGRTGKFVLTLDSRYLMNNGLNQTSIYLSRFQGDKVGSDNEIGVQAILLPPIDTAMANPPVLEMSTRNVDLGDIADEKRAKGTITIQNTGKSTLLIRSVQVMNVALGVDVRRRIEPGRRTDMKITLSPRFLKRQKGATRILMTTNDPKNPKVFITVSYKEQKP